MRKLVLSDEILIKVDKAARYIGGEVNSIMKDKNNVDIRFAMCFPDVCEMLFPSKRIYIIQYYVVSFSTRYCVSFDTI